jgi:hypothetical protein
MHFPQNLWPHSGLMSVSVQGSKQIGQLKSLLIIDLSDERTRKAVVFAVILQLIYYNLAVNSEWPGGGLFYTVYRFGVLPSLLCGL